MIMRDEREVRGSDGRGSTHYSLSINSYLLLITASGLTRPKRPAKILTQGEAAQRQWLAQHYRGLNAPGLLSPDILQPAGL